MKHYQNQREHARRRFWERLGIDLSVEEYHKLSEKCLDRKFARFVGISRSNRDHAVLNITYKNLNFNVVVHRVSGKIVTVLTCGKLD